MISRRKQQPVQVRLTLHLFETLAVKTAHKLVLLAEKGDAASEREGNAKIIAIEFILAIGSFIAQGGFHLLNCCNEALGFLCHLLLFSVESECQQSYAQGRFVYIANVLVNKLEMVIQSLRQRAEQLSHPLALTFSNEQIMQAYLGLAHIPLVRGNADLVEDAMKLLYNIVDLGGQVACINSHRDLEPYQKAR